MSLENYIELKKNFDKSFSNYTIVKEEYYKFINFINKEFHNINITLDKQLNSNAVFLNNLNVLFEEYVKDLENELEINETYEELKRNANELIAEINSIEDLYCSSKIHFLNDNKNYVVFLLLSELMDIPIKINNTTYVFHEDLKDKISKRELI